MRNFLNVLVDIVTLLAVAVAGAGHMFPWFAPAEQHLPSRQVPEGPPFLDNGNAQERAAREQERAARQQEARREREAQRMEIRRELKLYQNSFANWSGVSLGVLGLLAVVSLVGNWGQPFRRILVLLMFASAVAAIYFVAMGFSTYAIPEHLDSRFGVEWGFFLALIPTGIAAVFCLLRMLWTMPFWGEPAAADRRAPSRI